MKLQAVTVSVNYPDFLDYIAPNNKHFDRWIIVTDESDEETIKVCEKHGLEYFFSKRLYENGAVFDKAKALNEGLDYLDNSGWVAVMDSDILLPAHFRERVDAQDLEADTLYGLAARRVCLHHDEFRVLSDRQPWRHAWRARFVIGYFHLFHFGQEHNRYREETSDDASTYDVVFSDLFPESRKRKLPMACLHLGPVSQNWRGRKAKLFTERKSPVSDSGFLDLLEAIAPHDRDGTTVAQIGYGSGKTTASLAASFGKVLLFDQWQIDAPHHDQVVEADRAVLRNHFADQIRGLTNTEKCGGHSSAAIAEIEDASLDALYFDGEIDYDFLLAALPEWIPKLKAGAFVCGAFFGHPHWPESTYAISLLLGIPGIVCGDSSWAFRIPERETLAGSGGSAYPLAPPVARRVSLRDLSGERGVLLVNRSRDEIEQLIVCLHSLRKHWSGPVCVVETREETPSLRIACRRYAAGYLNTFDAEGGTSRRAGAEHPPDIPASDPIIKALQLSPFSESLFLRSSVLVVGPIDDCFDCLESQGAVFEATNEGDSRGLADAIGAWREDGFLPAASADRLGSQPLVGFDLLVFRRNTAVLERWADLTAVAIDRDLPLPDEVGGLVALVEAGTEPKAAPEDWIHSSGKPSPHARFVRARIEDQEEDDRAYETWAENEEAVIRSMASELRVPASVTVVTYVHPENIEVFYRNWHAWRFPGGLTVKVLVSGLGSGDLFFVRPEEGEIHQVGSDEGISMKSRALLLAREIPPLIETGHWIYLDPAWYPLPGAELFMHEDWLAFDLVTPAPEESAPASFDDSAPRLDPDPDFALVGTEFSSSACAAGSSSLFAAAQESKTRIANCDAQLMGWQHVSPASDSAPHEHLLP